MVGLELPGCFEHGDEREDYLLTQSWKEKGW